MIEKIEDYAKKNNIPIMLPDGILFLTNYIKENNVKNVLEIGTAIGYSSIRMALVDKSIHVTTIERDEERYKEALKNIKLFNLENQIDVILDDAFNVELSDKYDLIFIDAAKSQSIKFFEKFKLNLSDNGAIVTDNINFHGLTKEKVIKNRNTRQLVRKIREYVEFLENNQEFTTYFVEDGDGISISKRIKSVS